MNREKKKKNLSPYFLFLAIFFLYFLLLTPLGEFNDWIGKNTHQGFYSISLIDAGDDAGSYAYVRSSFFDGDLDFFNEKGYWHFDKITETGYAVVYWPCGSAILWFPFVLLAHCLVYVYNIFGYPIAPDGNSFIYHSITGIASGVYVFLGLLLSFQLIQKYASRWAAAFSVIIVFLSTHLPYFTFIRQRMSHAGEFFLIVSFIYLWVLFRENRRNKWLCLLWGISIGMLFNIRYNTLTFLIIPLMDLFYLTYWNKREALKEKLRSYFFVSIGALVTIIPQLLSWKIIFGTFRPKDNLNIIGWNFSNPFLKLSNLLLAKQWGLFLAEPIWLICLVGLFLGLRKNGLFSFFFLVAIIFPMGTVMFITGVSEASLGHRWLLSCNFFLSYGLSMLIDSVKFRFSRLLFLSVGFFVVSWQYLLIAQYKILLPYNHPEYSLVAFKNLWVVISERSELLLRSSNFIKLLSFARLDNYIDYFFMVFLPLIMFLFLSIVVIIFMMIGKRINDINYKNNLIRRLTIMLLVYFVFIDIAVFSMKHEKNDKEKFVRYKAASLLVAQRFPKDIRIENYILKAMKINPKDPDLYNILYSYYYRTGKIEEANEIMERKRRNTT